VANRENLEREIVSLEQALAEARDERANAKRALEDLEGLRAEAAGRFEIACRASESYAARLGERREELTRVLDAELQARLRDAIASRDGAALRAAEAIAHLIASFDRLEAARASTAERIAELEAGGRAPTDVGPEPAALDEQWARLVDFVRARAQLALDDELVEAAASSPMGHDIGKLPEHLQVVARERRKERLRAESRAPHKKPKP
jgi:hypothetical protein